MKSHTLECVDCHYKLIGNKLNKCIEKMKTHLKEVHNRELIFPEEQYYKKLWTREMILANKFLLNPELIMCA